MSVTAAVLFIAACSDSPENRADDEPNSGEAPGPSESSASSRQDDARRQEVIDAYEAASDARIDALAAPEPDPDAPVLAQTHTGPMLEQAREVAAGLRAEGLAVRYPDDSVYRVEVESVAFDGEDVARLTVCAIDDGERIDVDTGEVLSGGVHSGRVNAAMQRVDGTWKLAESEQLGQEEGTEACAPE